MNNEGSSSYQVSSDSNSNSNSDEENSSFCFSPSFDYEKWKNDTTLRNNSLLTIQQTNVAVMEQFMLQQSDNKRLWGGSKPCHAIVNRDRVEGNKRLNKDYFSENPVYGDKCFCRRYRMQRHLFLRIREELKQHDSWWKKRYNAAHVPGLSSKIKMTAAIRCLAYGCPADQVDEVLRIGESTTLLCMKIFCADVVKVFGKRYLRSPNESDVARLLHVAEQRGFPGMLGNLDCMHWGWKNCPTEWAGTYAERHKDPTVILEAVASYDLWIWHAYFGMPGSNNDINVLNKSNLFLDLQNGKSPPANYSIMGRQFTVGYYLADGIYPKWSTLVKKIPRPKDPAKRYFAKMQEAYRKDVERAFGVLQARFAIVRNPARLWEKTILHDIMAACIIMHNIIVEDERDVDDLGHDYDTFGEAPTIEVRRSTSPEFGQFLRRYRQISDKNEHKALQEALIEHLWNRLGAGNQ